MKERAIIYTRVSTDEQNNGYSPADQKDKLYKYCENKNIEVVGFFHDDESGKSFNRPEWKKIMTFLKRNKNTVDYIYFLKWDRFSRNATEAYAEIAKLKKLNVEPRAIEQPLDLQIPEQKVLLAIYLTTPEVDNDRRALNILQGIRRGKKEGRWLGGCPLGYRNARNHHNRPIITPEGGIKEKYVKEAFKLFSTGFYAVEDLRKKLNSSELYVSRNSFWNLLHNKVYIGLIFVPAYKNEHEEYVKGQHTAIIDEATFYKCQAIFEQRKKKTTTSLIAVRDEFPLRGHLICPKCGKMLTGSSSKGKQGVRYPYYHCGKGCKERQSAEKVNEAFITLLGTLNFKPNRLKLFGEILKDKFSNNAIESEKVLFQIQQKIEKYKQRLANARTLMLDGDITSNEYKEMKIEIENSIVNETRNMIEISNSMASIDKKIIRNIELLANIKNTYLERDVEIKRRIISSMFPDKLVFEKNSVRTLFTNQLISLIINEGKPSSGSKKEKHTDFGVLSLEVESEGFEPSSKR